MMWFDHTFWLQLTQKYDPHHDYFSHDGKDDNGGNRMATVLMYLEAADEGGETVFPKVAVPANQTKEAGYSDCAMQVGKMGLYWFAMLLGRA